MKKPLIIIVAAIMLSNVSGCFPVEKKNVNAVGSQSVVSKENEESTSEDELISKTIDKKVSENFEFKASIDVSEVGNLKSTKAKLMEFDTELVKKTFFNDSISVDERTHDDGVQKMISLSDENINFAGIYTGSISYSKASFKNRPYNLIFYTNGNIPYIEIEKIKEIFNKSELDSVDKSKAVSLADEKIKQLGITNFSEPEVVTFDVATLKNEISKYEVSTRKIKENFIFDFEKEDEGYLISYKAKLGDAYITQTGYSSDNNGIECIGTRVYVFVTAEGIIEFNCQGVYDINEDSQGITEGITFEQAVSAVENKYKDVILKAPITITQAEFSYLPVAVNEDEYTLEPYWVFTAEERVTLNDEKFTDEKADTAEGTANGEESEDVYYEYFNIYISCETGQELTTRGRI